MTGATIVDRSKAEETLDAESRFASPCQPAGAGEGGAGGVGQGRPGGGPAARAHARDGRCAGRPGPAAHAAAQEHGRAGGRISSTTARPARRWLGPTPARAGSSTSRTCRWRRRLPPCRTRRPPAMFEGPTRRPGLGRAARQEQGDPRRGRLSADRHLELCQRRSPHQVPGRAQRRAESRRHAAHPLRPARTTAPSSSCAARPGSSTTGTCSACAAPAATAIRSRTCSFPTRTRRRATSPTSGARRGRSIRSARRCSTPAASAA